MPALRTICIAATAVGIGPRTYRGYFGAVTAQLSELIGKSRAQASALFEAVQTWASLPRAPACR
jgi:aspartate ammonia-lyase